MSRLPLGSKRLVMAAAAVVALVGAGVAVAAGFGAFNESSSFYGISAAQHRTTAADELDAAVAASFAPDLRRDAGVVRFVRQLGDGVRIYAVATSGGRLCSIAERLPGPHRVRGKPTEIACNMQLSQKRPTAYASFYGSGEWAPISWGFALDNVTAVSFKAGGRETTVPVRHNVWAYHGIPAGAVPLTVHFTDGRTATATR